MSSRELNLSMDLDALRERLRAMTDGELLRFGKQMHALCYPRTYGPDGFPRTFVLFTPMTAAELRNGPSCSQSCDFRLDPNAAGLRRFRKG